MTKYAKAIIELISASNDHLTADDIYERLRVTYPGIVLATVYNNLASLCEGGFIRKITMDGEPNRYDKIIRHDHLVCKNCKALMDIKFDDLTEELKLRFGEGYIGYDLKVMYICPDCRRRGVTS